MSTYEQWQERRLRARFPQWDIRITPSQATAARPGFASLSVRSPDVLQALLYGSACNEVMARIMARYRSVD